MRARIRVGLGAAVLLATVTALTGCYSIPQHSDVTAAQARDQQLPDSVGFAPAPPKAGADPQAIVAGFIAAGTGQARNYAVARQFLAPEFAARWKPEASVLVHSGGARLTTDKDIVRYSVAGTAQINSNGIYQTLSGQSSPLKFIVARSNGQWRITTGPQGIVLGEDDFDRLFTPRALYFPSDDAVNYVPDLRWFRSGVSPTTLVRSLTLGASPILREGVTTNPIQAAASVTSVTIADRAAAVSLRSSNSVPGTQARRIATQIGSTLQALRPIDTVRLFVNNTLAATTGATPPTTAGTPATMTLRGDSLGYLPGGTKSGLLPLSKAVAAGHPTSVTYLSSRNIAAGTTTRGLTAWTKNASSVLDRRTNLLDPSIDQWGCVWSADPQQPTRPIVALNPRAKQSLALDLPSATSIQAIEVSPDGYRLLLLYTTNQGPAAEVRGIIRDAAGKPTGLTNAVTPLPLHAVEGIDATWVGTESVAILSQTNDANEVTTQQIGGTATDLGQVTGAVAIASGATPSELAVLLKNGDVATTQSAGVWTTIESNVAALGSAR